MARASDHAATAGTGGSLTRSIALSAVCMVLIVQIALMGNVVLPSSGEVQAWQLRSWLGTWSSSSSVLESAAPFIASGASLVGWADSDVDINADAATSKIDADILDALRLLESSEMDSSVSPSEGQSGLWASNDVNGSSSGHKESGTEESADDAAVPSLYDPAASMREVLDIIEENAVSATQMTGGVEPARGEEDDDVPSKESSGEGDEDDAKPDSASPAAPKTPKPPKSRKPMGVRLSRSATPLPQPYRTMREARSMWRTRYPEPTWMKHMCSQHKRYLHVVTAREGMASWVHAVYEALAVAKSLGRYLVEPCVRAGAIVPCWPDRVASLPATAADALGANMSVSHDFDPLAVPAFAEACETRTADAKRLLEAAGQEGRHVPSWLQEAQGRAYPLRLYLDLSQLARVYPRIVSWDEWLRCARKKKWVKNGKRPWGVDTLVSPKTGHIFADRVYCVTDRGGLPRERTRGVCGKSVGPFRFSEVWSPPQEKRVKLTAPEREPGVGHMTKFYRSMLAGDRARNIYLSEVWRGSLLPAGAFARLPAFNDIHRLALRAWLKAGVDGVNKGPYRKAPKRDRHTQAQAGVVTLFSGAHAAFHWVTGAVPEWKLPACATSLAARTAWVSGWGEWVRPPPPSPAKSPKPSPGDPNGVAPSVTPTSTPSPSGAPLPPFHPGTLLLSDVPAPSNPCAVWGGASGGRDRSKVDLARVSPARRKAVADMLAGSGLRKYDGDMPAVDAGVIAIREYLLARDAVAYTTCAGAAVSAEGARWTDAECRACAHSESPYVQSILAVRKAKGKRSVGSWFTGRSAYADPGGKEDPEELTGFG